MPARLDMIADRLALIAFDVAAVKRATASLRWLVVLNLALTFCVLLTL